jgi:hypothetical protein
MKSRYFWPLMLVALGTLMPGCQAPEKVRPVQPVKIADGEIDPAEWGKA